jgi:hypothetical protein
MVSEMRRFRSLLVDNRLEALEKQIKLFAQRLFHSRLRLNELETEPQETRRIYRHPK